MTWTAKAILGLMLILALWAYGFFGLDWLIRSRNRHDPWPDWQLLTIIVLYVIAGPGSGALWVCWARKRAGEECAEETRERIGALRVTQRPLKPAPAPAPGATGRLEGVISLTGLPAHRGLILNLSFYGVSGFEAPPPYEGDPPAGAAVDVEKVVEDIHLDVESTRERIEHPFAVSHVQGYFYIAVRAILFRERDGKTVGHVEQFFFGLRPLRISEGMGAPVTFPVAWPPEDLGKLQHYGTFKPDR